jgi:hypothetical protein
MTDTTAYTFNVSATKFTEEQKRLYYVLESYLAFIKGNTNADNSRALQEYDITFARMKNLIDTAYPMTMVQAYGILEITEEDLKKEVADKEAMFKSITDTITGLVKSLERDLAEPATEVAATPAQTTGPKKRGPKPGFKRKLKDVATSGSKSTTTGSAVV